MTWECAGMTWGVCGNDVGDASCVRARVFAAFRRILSDSVEGELGHCRLGIADCRLMIGDCKVSPWAGVWLEWPWV